MMIRRAVLAAAAAVALILTPSVAMAYEAPGFNCTVSDSTPTVGDSVTVVCSGAAAGEVLTLTGVGTGDLTATANASGVATFTFTVTVAGVQDLQVLNDAGDLVSDQTLTVLGAGGAAGPVAGGGQLSNTGFDGMGLAVGGGVLVLAGAGAVLISRRRKSAQVPA